MSLISKSSESWNVYELLIKKLSQILNDEDETVTMCQYEI